MTSVFAAIVAEAGGRERVQEWVDAIRVPKEHTSMTAQAHGYALKEVRTFLRILLEAESQ